MLPAGRNKQLDQEAARRELRTRIARGRLRIERDARAVRREAAELRSWRTYVRRYPGSAILAAMAAGLFFSTGLPSRRLSGWFVRLAAAQMFAFLRQSGADELRSWLSGLWSDRS